MLEIERDSKRMRAWVLAAQAAGRRVGFVPTMGSLHAGHASLVDCAARECDEVAVSIFVNPTQFGPHEDFERYPRSLDADCRLMEARGVGKVFAPETSVIYPPGDATRIVVSGPARRFEGELRPGHFEGVATVVCRLFLAAPADVAYFGAKDWQQTLVVKRMVCDLGLPIDLVVCPTLREPDGLAMSSRNAYLSLDERTRAIALFESLTRAEQLWLAGDDASGIEQAMQDVLRARGITIDYAAVVDPLTLEPLSLEGPHGPGGKAVALVAGRVGATRLIDNRELPPR